MTKLFVDQGGTGRSRWGGGRDRERHPRGVAFGSVLGRKVLIGFQIEIALMLLAKGKQEADLGANAGHTAFEIAELCTGAAVAGKLLKEIAGDPDLDILTHELRCGPRSEE